MSFLDLANFAVPVLSCLGTWVGVYYARRSDRAKVYPS